HCLAVDREDRFVIAGGSGGNLQLIPLKDALTDSSLRESPPAVRLAVPGDAELALATDQLKKAYKAQWNSTKPEESAILLDRLMLRTVGKEPPATRLALFHAARDVALKAGKLAIALQLAEDTVKWFDIAPLAEKTATLAAAAATTPPAVQKEVVD